MKIKNIYEFDKRAFLIRCVTNAGFPMSVEKPLRKQADETLDEEIARGEIWLRNLKQTKKTLKSI